ncbi:MAG: hypothetical protein KatS3mg001_180 [Candidatus Pacearchaeota archaeon]|nr:MAG: hypothetical protein KatS3mg001_180 [Candidatus Pacearchaeota archaeon]
MFKKKRCNRCGEKISSDYNFCPYCGVVLTGLFKDEDYGLLGRNDFMFYDEPQIPSLNSLINSLVKSINEQFNNLESEKQNKKRGVKKSGISISISTSDGKPPEIRVSSFGKPEKLRSEKKLRLPIVPAKKFAGLPKEEPETNVRRLSNKVVYEINLPGVNSIKDVSIVKLENSIEIKALSKGKVFYKVIPVDLPIKRYNLTKGKLILELFDAESLQ